ncbi:MAG TPA: enoyl-CoA hydratase/isomerase family protein [Actinophytocola sp.]|uniref:enoyl-CoA hydratase/isomerase family protein n=1 Tax=Actinophytocola sp. TaxID=1872138 RepID=UPI002F933444
MIETTDESGIAVLRLNRAPVNALDVEILSDLPRVLADVADAAGVVLTGTGRCLSAGVDLIRIVEDGPEYVADLLTALSTAVLALFDHSRPVVAAINGHALAGGCVLAAACDLRLMSAGTIGVTELAAGVPFPTVPLEVLRHAAGSAADGLVLTGRRLAPEAARAIGLVDEVVAPGELMATAVDRARHLAEAPTEVYALSKNQLRRPTRARIDANQPIDDPRVLELWRAPATHERLRSYLESLHHRQNRAQATGFA